MNREYWYKISVKEKSLKVENAVNFYFNWKKSINFKENKKKFTKKYFSDINKDKDKR